VFDKIADLGILAHKPKIAAWQSALAIRPSVRIAVAGDYSTRLRQFLKDQNSYLRTMMPLAGEPLLGKPHGGNA
jgi:glutathione S-transferase